jgi:probable HAF family extracellular repeat protein
MKIRTIWLGVAAGLLLAWGQPAAAQQPRTFQYSNFQIPGAQMTEMTGVNNLGNLSGNYTDAGGVTHCALVEGHTVTNINDPNGTGSSCFRLNNLNQVAGSYATGSFSNGFVYSASSATYTDIIVPTATAGTVAVGINDGGKVVGYFADNVGTHGFLFNGTTYQQLDMPGVIATFAVSINNGGLIAVQGITSGGAFISAVYNGTTYRPLNVPGASSISAIETINNHNQCVFTWTDASGNEHGSFYSQGVFTQLDYPGAFATHADGLNDHGLIVGPYTPTSGAMFQSYRAK